MATAADDELKEKQLSLVAAMLEKHADCTRILSRDCQELDVDPRRPLRVSTWPTSTCGACLDKIITANDSSVLEQLTSGAYCSNCFRYGRSSRWYLYDVAALRGQIEVLCTLPALYDDIAPREQSAWPLFEDENQCVVTSQTSDKMLTSRTHDAVTTSQPNNQVTISQPADEAMTPTSDDRAAASKAHVEELSTKTQDKIMTSQDEEEMVTSQPNDEVVISQPFQERVTSKPTDQVIQEQSATSTVCVDNEFKSVDPPTVLGGVASKLPEERFQEQDEDIFFDAADVFLQEVETVKENEYERGATILKETQTIQQNDEEEIFVDAVETLLSDAEDEKLETPPPENTEEEEDFTESVGALFLAEETSGLGSQGSMDHSQASSSDRSSSSIPSSDTVDVPKLSEDTEEEEDFTASLDTLFLSEETATTDCQGNDQASSNNGSNSPSPATSDRVGGPRSSEHDVRSACRHTDSEACSSRRVIVMSAVQKYLRSSCDPERLLNVLRCQPCSEDVINVFDILAELPEIKAGLLDLSCLIGEYGTVSGAHTKRTPLMSACRYDNEALMQNLLTDSQTDVNARDTDNCTPFHHLVLPSKGHTDLRQRMINTLRLYQARRADHGDPDPECTVKESPQYPSPGQQSLIEKPSDPQDDDDDVDVDDDGGSFMRKCQLRLCQLAWQPLLHVWKEIEDLSSLFDQEITIKCCTGACRVLLFPDLAYQTSGCDPPVMFHSDFTNNQDLFQTLEKGECPCAHPSMGIKTSISFLPACAAAAAGNIELFRRMLKSFVERLQSLQGAGSRAKCYSGKSALKTGGASAGSSTKVRFNTSMATFHSERLLAQVLRHVLYAGHPRELLRMLDDLQIPSLIHLKDDSKMSLLDLALRLGDEVTFLELLNRFGLDIQGDSDGLTPLLLVVSWGLVSLARKLLGQGARHDAENRYGQNALEIALRLEPGEVSDDMALMLLEKAEGQSDPKYPRIPSAFELAIVHKRFVLLDYLVQQGQVSIPEFSRHVSWLPVVSWCCIRQSHYTVARYLVDKGLDCFTPISFTGDTRTPLQECVSRDSEEAHRLVDVLIEKGADVNENTSCGYTPLVLAIKHSNLKVLSKLIFAGAILDSARPENETDENGEFPATGNDSGSAIPQSGLRSVNTHDISGTGNPQNGSGSATRQSDSGSANTQNGTRSANTQNGTGSANTLNGTGSANTQNGTGSANTLNGTGSANTQDGAGSANPQNGTGSANTQDGTRSINRQGVSVTANPQDGTGSANTQAVSVTANPQNCSGCAATQSGSMSAATQSGSMSAATQSGPMSAATQSGSMSAATQSGSMSASTQNSSMSAATQSGSMSAATQSGSMSAATQSGSMSAATQSDSMSAAAQSDSMSAATQSGSTSAATQNSSVSTTIQNYPESPAIENSSRFVITQNGSGSTTTQNDVESAFTQNNAGSTTAQNASGSATTQTNPGSSTTIQSNPGPSTAQNNPGSSTTENYPGSSTTIQTNSGSCTTQNNPGSSATTHTNPGSSTTAQNTSGSSTTTQNNAGSSSTTQNNAGSSSTTQNNPGSSATTHTNPGPSTTAQNTPGSSTTTQNNPGSSSTTQNNAGSSSTTQNNPGSSRSTQSNPGSSSTAQNNPGSSSTTQNNPGSSSTTQNNPGPSATQNNPGPSATQNNPGPSATQNNPGPSATQNRARTAATFNVVGSATAWNGSRTTRNRTLRVDTTQNFSFLWRALNSAQYKVVEMALVGGYRPHREAWYVRRDFPPRTPQEVIDALDRVTQQPLSLLCQCRRTLRENVGSRLPAFLVNARLPQAVCDYISMKDLVEAYLT